MTRISVALMCLAFACAAPSPTEYWRGTPTAPAPAPVRPGVGAPIYDPQHKPLPPQPQPKPKRLLPPTREPGIWAVEEDDRSPEKKAERGPDRFVFGMGLPFIPGYEEDEFEQVLVFKCAQKIEDLINKSDRKITWLGLSVDEKFCSLARLYEFCAYKSRAWKDDLEKTKVADGWDVVFNKQIESAGAFKGRVCVKGSDTPKVGTLLELLTEQWDRRVGAGF